MTVIAYLELILLVVEQGTTVSGYSWFQIFTDPIKLSYHIFIFCSVLFSQISLGVISLQMKPMPMIFFFVAYCEAFSQTYIFYWKPCLVSKMR